MPIDEKLTTRQSIVKGEARCRYPQITEHRTQRTLSLLETTKVILKLFYL